MGKKQVFGIVTYDALFKWVLSDDSIRPSFFHAFIPDIVVKSSERLDDHLNPLQELQLLRYLVNNGETTDLVTSLKKDQSKLKVHLADSFHKKATEFLKSILEHFDDIQYSFPKPFFNGTMDFVCKLDTGEYALIEMQIVPEDHWDRRALAYIAAFYGNQLRKNAAWEEIRKVIGLNILGGGRENKVHWEETPYQYVRHYKFQEQLHQENPPRFLEGIDIIQYSLANAPKNINNQERKDWLRFFKNAHNMSEAEVRREIKTPAVLEAFERAKLVSLPKDVREQYRDEEIKFKNLSIHIAQERNKGEAKGLAKGRKEGEAKGRKEGEAKGRKEGEAKGRKEGEAKGRKEGEAKGRKEGVLTGKLETAKALLKQGIKLSIIQTATGLSEEEIKALNNLKKT